MTLMCTCRCNHGQPDQDGGPTESVTMYDNEDRAPGPGVDGAGEAGVGNPDYFVVHPYGDSNMAAPYAVDYGTPSVYPVIDAAYNRATYAQVSSGQWTRFKITDYFGFMNYSLCWANIWLPNPATQAKDERVVCEQTFRTWEKI